MSLASIIAEVTAANEYGGAVDRHAAITAAVPLVMADEELVEQLVRAELSKRIKDSLCNVSKRLEGTEQQSSFFDLRGAHALDDGEGLIKQTRSLSRMEFGRLIAVREAQVAADMAYLKKLQAARDATSPIWDAHPDWLWGQVEDAFVSQAEAA